MRACSFFFLQHCLNVRLCRGQMCCAPPRQPRTTIHCLCGLKLAMRTGAGSGQHVLCRFGRVLSTIWTWVPPSGSYLIIRLSQQAGLNNRKPLNAPVLRKFISFMPGDLCLPAIEPIMPNRYTEDANPLGCFCRRTRGPQSKPKLCQQWLLRLLTEEPLCE